MMAALAEDLDLIAQLVALPLDELQRVIDTLTPPQLREFHERWPVWAHVRSGAGAALRALCRAGGRAVRADRGRGV